MSTPTLTSAATPCLRAHLRRCSPQRRRRYHPECPLRQCNGVGHNAAGIEPNDAPHGLANSGSNVAAHSVDHGVATPKPTTTARQLCDSWAITLQRRCDNCNTIERQRCRILQQPCRWYNCATAAARQQQRLRHRLDYSSSTTPRPLPNDSGANYAQRQWQNSRAINWVTTIMWRCSNRANNAATTGLPL